ncbi:hypothetical protein HOLleu_22049 [Holothuria leucospilota]|uniref:Uncharacterized protein n=1 Tax=Holothuria leucospilota TaxID=206669 RepID=A0A9Q1BYP4_HOLLE|nr:hypothetical protein HOLleu_22049 [Holothuria leucospilota]
MEYELSYFNLIGRGQCNLGPVVDGVEFVAAQRLVFVATGCCGLLLPACFGPHLKWRKHCALAYMLLNIVSGACGIFSIYLSSTLIHGNDMRVRLLFHFTWELK